MFDEMYHIHVSEIKGSQSEIQENSLNTNDSQFKNLDN